MAYYQADEQTVDAVAYESERERAANYIREKMRRPSRVKVTRPEPEQEPEPRSVKIPKKGMDEAKARYEQRKADLIMREAKEAGKEATRNLANKITRKQEKVEDEEVVEKVDQALKNKSHNPPTVKTRSEELREIAEKSYQKQKVKEDKKRTDKENAKAERVGTRKAMGLVDRNIDRINETREKVEAIEDKIDEVREAVSPGSTKAKQKAKKAPAKPVKMSAAEKRRLDAQIARSQRALAPKSRNPFGIQKKSFSAPSTQKSSGGLNRQNTGGLNKPKSSASGLNKPKTPSFGSVKSGNPFSPSRTGNPFGTMKHSGNPFGATSIRNHNPIGWSPKRITRL